MKITKQMRKDIEKRVKIHRQMMLARPKACRLRPFPDPELEQKLPVPVPRACLNPKLTPQILKLYHSSRRPKVPKFVRPLPPENFVKPSALTFQPTERLGILSLPPKRPPPPPPPPKSKKQKQWEAELRAELDNWLELRSKPKEIPPPPKLFIKKNYKPLSQLIDRLNVLATPALHHQWKRPAPPVFQLQEEPPLSERVMFLSQPRKINSEAELNLKYDPYEIKQSTLKAKITDRILRLAIPRPKQLAVDKDIRESEPGVSPAAMKYVASKRIVQLAKPRERK